MAKIKRITDKVEIKTTVATDAEGATRKNKRPRGRPHQGVIKENIVGFRLNEKQYEAVKEAAKRFGMSAHEWCRKVILEKIFKK